MPGDFGPMATIPGVCRIRPNLPRAAAAVARGLALGQPGWRPYPQSRMGTTYLVLVRAQNAVGDGTRVYVEVPGCDAPRVEMATRGADSASNMWSLHAPRPCARSPRRRSTPTKIGAWMSCGQINGIGPALIATHVPRCSRSSPRMPDLPVSWYPSAGRARSAAALARRALRGSFARWAFRRGAFAGGPARGWRVRSLRPGFVEHDGDLS